MALCVLQHDVMVDTVPLRAQLTVGRAPSNDLVLHEPSVSGHHAVFYQQGDATWVRDLGSTNGTFIRPVGRDDFERLSGPRRFAPGDHAPGREHRGARGA